MTSQSQFRVGSSETICKETSLFKKDKNYLTWLIGSKKIKKFKKV